MSEQLLILDFGSQYTQLIARRVRELNVYCEIVPFNKVPALTPATKGVILSGSPFSVLQPEALHPELDEVLGKVPVLGVCYGAQWLAHRHAGEVANSDKREYGRARLTDIAGGDALFRGIPEGSQVWMSHGDTITRTPEGFERLDAVDVGRQARREAAVDAGQVGLQLRVRRVEGVEVDAAPREQGVFDRGQHEIGLTGSSGGLEEEDHGRVSRGCTCRLAGRTSGRGSGGPRPGSRSG